MTCFKVRPLIIQTPALKCGLSISLVVFTARTQLFYCCSYYFIIGSIHDFANISWLHVLIGSCADLSNFVNIKVATQ